MQSQLRKIEQQLLEADPIKRLQLIQDRMDLQAELESSENKADLEGLEKDFIEAAKGYSERKGISYAAWRELGVDAAVLKKAGISRAS
ncbi:MAG: hypothetical protein ACLGIZ_09115 [Acidimicrobiia bacterium]